MKPVSITLIGMPTAGKTYLGERLAKDLAYDWVDFDSEIKKLYGEGKTIIENEGEKGLIRYESRTMLAAQPGETVFSCGGSCVYSAEAMEHLGSISEVIYLEVPLSTLKHRLVDYVDRAVVGAKHKTLEELYDERHPLYRRFAGHVVFDESGDLDRQYEKLLTLSKKIIDDKTKQ